jgi:hypothetical protein
MKTYGAVEIQLQTFSNPVLHGDEWSASPPDSELPVPIGQEAGWGPKPNSMRQRKRKKILPLPGVEDEISSCSSTLMLHPLHYSKTSTLKMEAPCSSETSVTNTRLQDVVTQKSTLRIFTAVKNLK